jgi:hypothetical protein
MLQKEPGRWLDRNGGIFVFSSGIKINLVIDFAVSEGIPPSSTTGRQERASQKIYP